MKGLELCKRFYEEYGLPMIESEFKEIEHVLAIGLFGEGSECFGFDDEISKDHDFEAGFCILLPSEEVVDRKTAFRLERAYSKLPKEFCGVKRGLISPVGGNRRGVMRMEDFLLSKVGKADGIITGDEWFTVPETFLAEVTNGEIFKDDAGTFTAIREYLSSYPKDVLYKKLAGNLLLAAQAGQYNYERCTLRRDSAAAQVCAIKFVEHIMNAMFLLEGKYKPYYKWTFKAFSQLKEFGDLHDCLEFLISSDNGEENVRLKSEIIADVCQRVEEKLKEMGITDIFCGDMEKYAYAVNDKISDPVLRTKNILSAV